MKKTLLILCLLYLTSCLTVRQQDLDAWQGVPVSALDTHSIFLTMPMVKTYSAKGTEIRNYVNGQTISRCNSNAYGTGNVSAQSFGNSANAISMSNFNAFQNCSSGFVACNNIFYIKEGRVLEYKPSGKCFTNETAQPEKGWENL